MSANFAMCASQFEYKVLLNDGGAEKSKLVYCFLLMHIQE